MSNKKTKGGLSKVLKLVSVLEKCNGKGTIGGKDALISPNAAKALAVIGVVFLVGIFAAAAYLVEPLIAPYVSLRDITNTLMLAMLLFSLVLSIKNIVTVLYTADDLPVLLPMPFSAGQIVTAKLVVSLKFPVILSFVITNSVLIGFGLCAGMDAAFYIGTVLSSVLVPVTGLAVAALFTVVIFKVFGFIRNRDVMVVIGGVFTLLLTVAYIVLTSFRNDESPDAALSILSTVSSVSAGFPNIAFMSGFMFDGNALGLLISVAITAAVIALALLVIKLFYLSTALSMQNTGTSNKAVTRESLGGKKVSALKALTSYESKNARRNPSYLIYGFAMTFIWPLFFCLPFVFGNNMIFSSIDYPFDTGVAMICALLLGIAASCFACGFNNLACTAFSREGKSISALRSMPLDFNDYYKSKRNFAMLICSLGSVAYIIILGIICVAFGVVSAANCWVFLLSALVCFLCDSIIINCALLKNAKNPVFNWDSETEISRKLGVVNIIAIIIGFVMYIAMIAAIIISASVSRFGGTADSSATTLTAVVVCAVFALVISAVAFLVNKLSVKKAKRCLAEFE